MGAWVGVTGGGGWKKGGGVRDAMAAMGEGSGGGRRARTLCGDHHVTTLGACSLPLWFAASPCAQTAVHEPPCDPFLCLLADFPTACTFSAAHGRPMEKVLRIARPCVPLHALCLCVCIARPCVPPHALCVYRTATYVPPGRVPRCITTPCVYNV